MNINYPLLLDGGLSNELEKLGLDLNHNLWSARILEQEPEAIVNTHLAYLESGAQCILTSSYQATIQGFMEIGLNRATAEEYIMRSVRLAENAIGKFLAKGFKGKRPLIAASIGPYGAYLADGSEYSGNYGVSDEELHKFHESRIRILDSSNADFFACETIPSYREAQVLSEILRNTKKNAWISFSCKDDIHINDGTPIAECATLLSKHPNVFAVGVNCTAPKYISGLISVLKSKAGSKKIVVYPNSGEAYNADSKTWLGMSDHNSFALMAKEWAVSGADIIGGCCRIGPKHIKSTAAYLV